MVEVSSDDDDEGNRRAVKELCRQRKRSHLAGRLGLFSLGVGAMDISDDVILHAIRWMIPLCIQSVHSVLVVFRRSCLLILWSDILVVKMNIMPRIN